ncbi:hypothetical protein KBD75_04320 [Candidatus Woesebacteria bacterium]|nr:hypothetical protein [Candidatus Woesebacteria bacterium]
MASDYNSQLISELYSVSTADFTKAEYLLREMESIGDEVFVHPIKDAYLRFKDTAISHYFISSLGNIKSEEVLSVLISLMDVLLIKKSDFTFSLRVFEKFKYVNPKIIEHISLILSESPERKLSSFNFEFIFSYLRSTNSLSTFDGLLFAISMDASVELDTRSVLLHYYILSHPDESLKCLNSLAVDGMDKSTQVLIAKESIRWKGAIVDSMHQSILASFTSRAKEIVKEYLTNNATRKLSVEPTTDFDSRNAKSITSIYNFRKRINIFTEGDDRFGFPLFEEQESLIEQIIAPTTELDFGGKLILLREQFQMINNKVGDHGMSADDMGKLFSKVSPGTNEQDYGKPLNQVYCFLKVKKISDDYEIYGIRRLNRLCSLLGGHPREKSEILKILKELNLHELYTSQKWQALHSKILELYKDSLANLWKNLSEDARV